MPIVHLLVPDNISASLSVPLSNPSLMKKFISNRIPNHAGKKLVVVSSLSPSTGTNDSDKASIYSTVSGDKKKILDAFWDDSAPDMEGNSKKLMKRYKKVVKSIDSLEKKVWENLAGSMSGGEESEKSILGNFVRTSKAPYNEEIKELSHQIIYRLIISGIASLHTSDTEFVKSHLDFLATKYPASLLFALTVSSSAAGETQNFISFVSNTWPNAPLGSTCTAASDLLRSYSTVPHLKLADNIQAYAQVLLGNLTSVEENGVEYDDLSLFVGLFPWMYFKLQPGVGKNEWHQNTLPHSDPPFANRTSQIFNTPTSRRAILANLASYHGEDEGKNTVLHVLMYVSALEMFPLNMNTKSGEGRDEKGKGKGKEVVHDVPESIKKDLIRQFKPGRWMAQTFYTSTLSPLLLSSFRTLYGAPSTLTLVRFIAMNLGRWEQIKRGSAGEWGMVRGLFLGVGSCGVDGVVVRGYSSLFAGEGGEGEGEERGLSVEEWKEAVWGLCRLLRDVPPTSPQSALGEEQSGGFLSRHLSRKRSGSNANARGVSKSSTSSNSNNISNTSNNTNNNGNRKTSHKQTPSIVITSPPTPTPPLPSPTFLSPTSASGSTSPTSPSYSHVPTPHPITSQINISTALESPNTCIYETLCTLVPATPPTNPTKRMEIQNEMCVGLLRVALLCNSLDVSRVLLGVVQSFVGADGSEAVGKVLEGVRGVRGELWEE